MSTLSHTPQTTKTPDGWLLSCGPYAGRLISQYFEPRHWQRHSAHMEKATGRGTAWLITKGRFSFVLKQYQRGGLVQHINHQHYFYMGRQLSRPYRELALLSHLKAQGLPVPTPIGGYIQRHGLWYCASLITEQIPHAQTLQNHLETGTITTNNWLSIGRTVAKLHQQQLIHPDLNVRNILIDHESTIWLIDFDKGSLKSQSTAAKHKNLERLLRSLRKSKQQQPALHWQESDWAIFKQGYLSL